MARSVFGGVRRLAPALLVAALACAGGAAPARAQIFPWDQPERRPQPEAPQQLSTGDIREILAREGARLVGAPRRRGPDVIAIGRDEDGGRKRFTLDAISGELLDVTVLSRREDRRPPPFDERVAPGEPLPPPDHGTRDGSFGSEAPPPGPAPAAPAQRAPVQNKATTASPVAPAAPAANAASSQGPNPASSSPANPSDAALSPIKPLKPAGAPKVEPLPQ